MIRWIVLYQGAEQFVFLFFKKHFRLFKKKKAWKVFLNLVTMNHLVCAMCVAFLTLDVEVGLALVVATCTLAPLQTLWRASLLVAEKTWTPLQVLTTV